MEIELYRDLEAYHGWAMRKVLDRCRILERSALTTEMPLGPGSLLATLQHMATAERVWLARWRHQPLTGIPSGPDSLETLESLFAACAAERAGWFENDPDVFSTKIQYKDLRGGSNEQRLGDLVMHVFNHAVHHRAQVVHFLKRYGQTFPGGIDYIFFRIAKPTILLRAEVAAGCRQWGLEVGETAEEYIVPDFESLNQSLRYGDWAMEILFEQCRDLTDEQLDHDRGMGVGSIRKTLLHIYDAECFWQSNWESKSVPFPSTPVTTSIHELSQRWSAMSEKKSNYLQRSEVCPLRQVVSVDVGGGPMEFRLSESLIQLSVHGTLHRAQITNMIRACGKIPTALDVVVWLRQSTPSNETNN